MILISIPSSYSPYLIHYKHWFISAEINKICKLSQLSQVILRNLTHDTFQITRHSGFMWNCFPLVQVRVARCDRRQRSGLKTQKRNGSVLRVDLISYLLYKTRNFSSGFSCFGMSMMKYCLLKYHFLLTVTKICLKWQKIETSFMKHKIMFNVSS